MSGFCALTPQKNSKAKLHALHANTDAVAKALRRDVVKSAKGISANALSYTAPGTLAATLTREGWTAGTVRGQYITFEKAL